MTESQAVLYRAMMIGQKKGIATEKNLLDIARFWWYDGYEGFETDCQERMMDWNFVGMVVSLFLLGFAYGIMIDLYIDMIRYRRKWNSRNRPKQ